MAGDRLSNTATRRVMASNLHERFGLPSFEDNIFLMFGYGSILWKQEFEYAAEYVSYIKGYTRLFHQGTTAHRGVPGAPGRVVTLLPNEEDAEARVYGKAYQLPEDPQKMYEIFEKLDVREGGYDRVEITLYDGQKEETELDIFQHPNFNGTAKKNVVCLCYIATPQNNDYLGDAPMEEMAAQILRCAGPSGPNRDYLFFLADCLREMGAHDPHVYELDATAKRLLREQEDANRAAVYVSRLLSYRESQRVKVFA